MEAYVRFDAKPIYLSSSNRRKIMKANDMEVASWKSIRPPTPQQRDARSCGVYVIKVGTWPVLHCILPRTTLCFHYRPVRLPPCRGGGACVPQ